eukprot:7196195-Ditylum_brightwellii.AAC.1
MRRKSESVNTVYHCSSLGPTFGANHDMCVGNNANRVVRISDQQKWKYLPSSNVKCLAVLDEQDNVYHVEVV